MTTWRKELTEALAGHNESWVDVEASTLSDEQMNAEFDPNWGSTQGCSFTVWTKKRVYFPACYDGSEWVESVSRVPDGIATDHIGGG